MLEILQSKWKEILNYIKQRVFVCESDLSLNKTWIILLL